MQAPSGATDAHQLSAIMSFRRISLFLIATGIVACQAKSSAVIALPTTTVTRGDIAVRVQATGVVEPINPVDIKSKAGGAVVQEPVEVGSIVKKGDLLAQIDPRDVKNKFDQAMADDVVAATSLDRAMRDRARKDSLFKYHVITASANDSTKVDVRRGAVGHDQQAREPRHRPAGARGRDGEGADRRHDRLVDP